MNKELIKEPDPLTRYLGAGKIEKAPSGFTSKVMENIRVEAVPAVKKGFFQRIATIPVISFVITALLLVTVILIPENQNNTYADFITSQLRNLITRVPVIDLKSVLNFNLPEVIIWVIAGLIFLSIFDRALQGFFQKEK